MDSGVVVNGFAFGLDMDARKRKAHAWATQEGFPSDSWWMGLDREAFYQKAREEQPRITRSRFGRTDFMSTGRNVPLTARHESIFGGEEE